MTCVRWVPGNETCFWGGDGRLEAESNRASRDGALTLVVSICSVNSETNLKEIRNVFHHGLHIVVEGSKYLIVEYW